MRGVKLPSTLSAAIEAKLGMEQESQRMEFVLKREEQEAKRKAVEAQGIAEVSAGCGAPVFMLIAHCSLLIAFFGVQFQKIVTTGITEDLLRWKAIEATTLLAQTPGSKVTTACCACAKFHLSL